MAAEMRVRKVIDVEVPGLGASLRQARDKDGRSLTAICAEVGMTTANWYKIENEETKILPVETLRKIEDVLGVSFGVKFESTHE